MQKSLIIARPVGPVLSAIGIGTLVNQPSYCALIARSAFFTALGIFLVAVGGCIAFKGCMA